MNKSIKYSIHILAVISVLGMVGYFLPAPCVYSDELYHDFVFPIATGYFLSYIFYILTVLIPADYRKKKIRKNLDLVEYEIYSTLFRIFDIIFDNSMYQKKIVAGTILKEDLNLALQNKCLHKEYIKADGYAEKFIAIGDQLKEASNQVDSLIYQVMVFNEYLSEEEIDIFLSIRKRLFTYDFDLDKALFYSPFAAKNQNIAYMSNNYYELYLLYKDIQKIVFKNTLNIRDIYFSKIQHFYYSEQYDKVVNLVKKDSISLPTHDKVWINQYFMLAQYKINNKSEAYKILTSLLQNDLDIISYRNIFQDMYDEEVKNILSQYCKEELIEKMLGILKNENDAYEEYRNNNLNIKNTY